MSLRKKFANAMAGIVTGIGALTTTASEPADAGLITSIEITGEVDSVIGNPTLNGHFFKTTIGSFDTDDTADPFPSNELYNPYPYSAPVSVDVLDENENLLGSYLYNGFTAFTILAKTCAILT